MRKEVEYQCEAVSSDAFVQHLAVSYLRWGYVFYVTGIVPKKRLPRDVDRKMISKYGITSSKFTRARRKRAGQPNAHYLRHGDFCVCLVTIGHEYFFDEEGQAVRDIRKTPIKHDGYAVGFYEGKISIRLDEGTYLNLRAHFEEIATKRKAETLAAMIYTLRFRAYRGVRIQLNEILGSVNAARKAAGLDQVPTSCVRWYRDPIKIYQPQSDEGLDAFGGVVSGGVDDPAHGPSGHLVSIEGE
jgi:hypothetical protein